MRSPTPRVPPGALFVLVFVVSYVVFTWVLGGSGPVRAINARVGEFTRLQARTAGGILALAGDDVRVEGSVIAGPAFSCNVEEGCNGMSALTLLVAGLVSFPAPLRHRLLGLAVLAPIVLAVNIIRIAGLYWTGAHWRTQFVDAHVYVGQVAVILFTAGLWVAWLVWTSRRRAARS